MIHFISIFFRCGNRGLRHNGRHNGRRHQGISNTEYRMMNMKIICNGAKIAVEDELSLAMFLRGKGLDPDTVAVACDGAILARETYADLRLREGMVLEVVRFVGGGASC